MGAAELRDGRALGGGVDAAEALGAVIVGAEAMVAGVAGSSLTRAEVFAVLRGANPESTESVFGMRSS